jgi:molecular chaperone DnaK
MSPNTNDAIGIDLGTTNSVAAVMEGDKPVVIPNRQGDRLTPSAVFLPEGGGVIVGAAAKDRWEQYPDRTFVSIKRRMGTTYRRKVDGRDYAPEEISSMILASLRTDAEQYLGRPATKAVITVPANFNSLERQATKSAGEIAGLDVLRVVNEPTAAALAYGVMNKLSRVVVVFDLGGGTFDISVVLGDENMYEVLYSLGDNRLGGDDLNMQILAFVTEQTKKQFHLDLSQNKDVLRLLRREVILAKHRLTDQEETRIVLREAGVSGGKRIDVDVALDRSKLGELVEPSLKRIRSYATRVVEELRDPKYANRYGDVFGHRLEKCDVVLVGGETRVLAVRESLRELFGGRVFSDINPDEVVALGAAVQAGIITRHEHVRDIVLVDSTSLSLGVEVKGGGFSIVVPSNTPIPATRTQEYFTVADNQTEVLVKVFQGESSIASQNKLLGEFTLYGVPPRPAGKSVILATFDLDANDILHVEARDKETAQRAQTTITGSQTLTAEEVARMRREAAERENQNTLVLRAARLTEQGAEALNLIQRGVAPLRPILSRRYLATLDGLTEALEKAMVSGNIHEMERCFFDLHHALPRPSEKQPSMGLEVGVTSGFRIDEWGRLQVILANRGAGAAIDVQVSVAGQTKETHTGAVGVVGSGATQAIPISILPTSAGDAVPIEITIEYKDEGGVPYMVAQPTTVQVARINQSLSAESRTLISIGEIINHSGSGDLYARSRRNTVAGDLVGGSKTGDVLSAGSGVNVGGRAEPISRRAPEHSNRLCPACGATTAPDAVFCRSCGEALGSKCRSCGVDLHDDPRFCPNCGQKVAGI